VRRNRWIHGLTRDDGAAIHFVEHGVGDPILLLHGFPDFWYMWRHQIPLLAGAGFRAIAVDLRGYNRSDAPPRVSDYTVDKLAHDVIRVLDTLSVQRAVIVGHDWGGIVAWHIAMNYPDRVLRLVVINAPHPQAYKRALVSSSQLLRSWYVFAVQLPFLPEFMLRRGKFRMLRRSWKNAARGSGTVTDSDVEKYVKAFSPHGKITAALNYYRAAVRTILKRNQRKAVAAPTLLIWGDRDPFLVRQIPDTIHKWVPHVEVRKVPYSHWPQLEAPSLVTEIIAGFLRKSVAELQGNK
jgi:pimeloyl-ACP methyl ester carboxylesterase